VCATCGARVLEKQIEPVLVQLLTGGTGLTLWRNARGYDPERKVKYGIGDGGADYLGLYAPHGLFVAVEMKTTTGTQQPNQIAFQALVERLGGVYAICRDEGDARQLLERLRGTPP
jgi:hypothetical protein